MTSPEGIKSVFYLSQIGIGVSFVLAVLYLRSRSQSRSGFREGATESEKKLSRPGAKDPKLLAEARMPRKEERPKPLQLPGIRLDGKAHEILGIAASAQGPEIQKAYRELMKRYHPDKVGPPGSREWTDAQKIAETINRAKDEMIKGLAQSQKPNRSGR